MTSVSAIHGGSTQAVADAAAAAAAAAASPQKNKLTDAAQQFEAVFLQEMLKPLQDSAKDEDDKDASPGGDTMSSYGTEAVARAIAKGGGLGIARQIVAKVTLEREQHAANGLGTS